MVSTTVARAIYDYNPLGLLTTTTYANGTTENNVYNPAGLLTSTINRRTSNNIIISQYDYTYYYNGNQRTKTDTTTTTIYNYDGRDQLIKSASSPRGGGALSTAEPIGIAQPTNVSVNISSNGQNRFFSFTAPVTGSYAIFSSNRVGNSPFGALYTSNWTLLNSDGDVGREFMIRHSLTAGTTYIIMATALSGTGNYSMLITSPSGITHSYPAQALVQDYLYDTNGNRTRMISNLSLTTYTYDRNDRLITEVKDGTTTTYSYDANGNNLTQSNSITQNFDVLNRMTSYTRNGTSSFYTYYPDNMRRSKQTGNVTTTHIWVDDNISLDMNVNNVVSSYIRGLRLIRSGYGWYLYNGRTDVVQLVNDGSTVLNNYDYDPYGNRLTTNSGNNPYLYCGEYFDTESGYTYLRARYYDPKIGRFINEDPVFDGTNWYVYCGNDPINRVDPSGLWSKELHYDWTLK